MSASAPHLGPDPIPQSVPDNTERLLTFLRQENAAHRDALREDAKANRELLTGTIRLVAYPVTAAIVFIGWFGVKSFSDLKSQLRDSATQQVKSETVRMQTEIRDRLNEQFQTANLRQTVKEAARDATQTAAKPLIESEITHQVQTHIREEGPQIHAEVISETKKGVADMQPRIDAEVNKQANAAEARI